jgi:hypothetical protein
VAVGHDADCRSRSCISTGREWAMQGKGAGKTARSGHRRRVGRARAEIEGEARVGKFVNMCIHSLYSKIHTDQRRNRGRRETLCRRMCGSLNSDSEVITEGCGVENAQRRVFQR